jgi:hypothetical protein
MWRGGVHAQPDARYEAAKIELERWASEAKQAGITQAATGNATLAGAQ